MRINNRSLGRKKAIPYVRLEFQAVYQPGRMEVRGYKSGKLIVREVTETTGIPTQLALTGDCNQLKADGCDVWIVNVSVKDKKGRVVPTADNLVKFTIDGPARIIGVGNGNPSSHEPDKANQRRAFNGYCQVLIQTTDNPGTINLSATSEGLKSATLSVLSSK